MNIIRNESLIKRNARIGQIAMFAGLLILGGGMFISFRYPTMVTISLISLLFGFIVSQVGIFYMNRWGRKPRPDELLDQALKGLDKKYTMYHYSSPVSHLLVGPSGLWVLLPYHQRGNITFSKGRWRQTGGGVGYAYLKIFAQEGLGRPEAEVSSEIRSLQDHLKKKLGEEDLPPIQTALVFLHPKTIVNIPAEETPPAETVLLKDLKDVVRKTSKGAGKGLSPEKARAVQATLVE